MQQKNIFSRAPDSFLDLTPRVPWTMGKVRGEFKDQETCEVFYILRRTLQIIFQGKKVSKTHEFTRNLTTARKLSLISLGQTLLQPEPNPWMINFIGRETLKFDSTTLESKEWTLLTQSVVGLFIHVFKTASWFNMSYAFPEHEKKRDSFDDYPHLVMLL